MITKSAQLSNKGLALLEQLIEKHGNVVDFTMIYDKLKKTDTRQEVKNFVSNLVKKGWLNRIKKGVFEISSIAGRGSSALSQLTIAQILVQDSYVSFEAALQYYGMFDQYLKTIVSISNKKSCFKKSQDWNFKFIKSKKNLFNSYGQYHIDGRLIKIAQKEKTIIDFLVYRRTLGNIDLLIEKLQNYKNEFDYNQIIKLAGQCSLTVQRTLGFLLDLIKIDSMELYQQIKTNHNYSFMTKNGNIFNARWRIYYDKYLDKYVY